MEHRPARHDEHQRLWQRYMDIERKELQDRKNGELAKVLGAAMAGESQRELDRLAREDQRKAEEGLVELREGDEVFYKHIDELTSKDRPARIEAQRRRLQWVEQRLAEASANARPGARSAAARDNKTSSGGGHQ